jgi:hypothetical protein
MNVYRNLFIAAAGNLVRYRTRTIVVVVCLVAICGPYVTGIAISEGIRADAKLAVQEGADLYLTLDQFGRNGPVPMKYLDPLRRSRHILKVVPRIVGRARAVIAIPTTGLAESELVVILGLEPGQTPEPAGGSLPATMRGGEVMIGSALAEQVGLQPGQQITLEVADVTRSFRVSAIFPRDATIWSAQLVCMTIDDAASLFALPGYASDLLIYCRPGPGNIQAVRQVVLETLGDIPYRLQTKNEEVAAYVDKGFRHQQGVFTAMFLVAMAIGIPALLVASGLGFSDRRREIGICKAVGWQTTDVLLMVMFEQVLLSLIASCLAVLVSYVWLRWFNGILVAQFFISEVGQIARFRVPARFTPGVPVLALLVCLVITLVGSLATAWRLAAHPSAECLR